LLAWLDLSDTDTGRVPHACHSSLQSLLLERGEAAELHHMPLLSVLSLSGSTLAASWSSFSLLPSLSTLCLSHMAATDEDVSSLLVSSPGLLRLDLSFCVRLTDSVLKAVGRSGRGLLLLRLYGCPLLTLSALRRLATALPSLRLLAPTSE
jgi:hypothetical protein